MSALAIEQLLIPPAARLNIPHANQRLGPLDPVGSNDDLKQAAADFAEYMASTGRYGNYANGKAPSKRVEEHGYDPCISAENIAHDFKTENFSSEKLAESVVAAWRQSPEHRKVGGKPVLVGDAGVGARARLDRRSPGAAGREVTGSLYAPTADYSGGTGAVRDRRFRGLGGRERVL